MTATSELPEVECRRCGLRFPEPVEHYAVAGIRCPGGLDEFGPPAPPPEPPARRVSVFVPPHRPRKR